MTKPTYDCAPNEESESSLCAQWVAKDLSFLHADSEDFERADAQAGLRLRWVQSFCWFCHEVAHMAFWVNILKVFACPCYPLV